MAVRTHLLLLLTLTLLLSGCGYSWQDYSSDEGKFSCRMPGKVKTESRSQALPLGGNITLHAHGVDLRNAAFMVAYADLPRSVPFDYKAAVDGMTQAWDGTVNYQKEVTVDGHKGVEFEAKIKKPKNGYAAGRIFVADGRLYEVIALGTNTKGDSKDVQEFMNSFKLKK